MLEFRYDTDHKFVRDALGRVFWLLRVCGNMTRTIWGDLSTDDRGVAVYYVQRTPGSPQHDPNIDLVIGEWGRDAKSEDRVLVSLQYRPGPERWRHGHRWGRPSSRPAVALRAGAQTRSSHRYF